MQKIIRTAALVVTIALTGLMGCVSVSSNQSNVPANRLIDGRYVSPDERFTLKVPRLVQPGMRIEERRLGPDTFGIFFADDFGTIYYLITTDNREHRFTMEQLAEEYSASSLIESVFIDTVRGRELRLTGVNEGGSPMVTRSTVDSKTVEQHNDQVEAWSLFIDGDEIYQLTAAIVPSSFKIGYQMYGLYVLYQPSPSDDSGSPDVSARGTADGSIDDFALGQVKMNLETFLAGLTITER